METRSRELQALLDATETALLSGAASTPEALPVTRRIFAALRAHQVPASPAPDPRWPPVCDHLATAFAAARAGPQETVALADAVAALARRLAWCPRAGSASLEPQFRDNHANAVVIGAGGLEHRIDVRVGLSLVAPGVTYPDHRHPPEEVYVVLSPGAWRQEDRPWRHRRPGDLVHNTPDVVHAMQAHDAPLLAVWCLWMG